MTGPTQYFPEDARKLLTVRGRDLLSTLGLPALRKVVGEVLIGVNVRNATDTLTRKRLSLLNAALLTTYLNGSATEGDFINTLTTKARAQYRARGTSQEDKIILRWMMGLTAKQVQNVLRSNETAWQEYIELSKQGLQEEASAAGSRYGDLSATLSLGDKTAQTDWHWALALLTAVGSQSLATRGSEKSLYGKFFEKLILGAVLNLLGFNLVDENHVAPRSFWLSSRGHKRESDATAIWELGEGVRFDIGFIGVGNPEITLDKVSRFEREIEIGGQSHSMHTFIIVDRVGPGSRVVQLAEDIGGTIIQMSSSDWPQLLGQQLEATLQGFKSPIAGLPHREYADAVTRGIEGAPFEKIFHEAVVASPDEAVVASENESEVSEGNGDVSAAEPAPRSNGGLW